VGENSSNEGGGHRRHYEKMVLPTRIFLGSKSSKQKGEVFFAFDVPKGETAYGSSYYSKERGVISLRKKWLGLAEPGL